MNVCLSRSKGDQKQGGAVISRKQTGRGLGYLSLCQGGGSCRGTDVRGTEVGEVELLLMVNVLMVMFPKLREGGPFATYTARVARKVWTRQQEATVALRFCNNMARTRSGGVCFVLRSCWGSDAVGSR